MRWGDWELQVQQARARGSVLLDTEWRQSTELVAVSNVYTEVILELSAPVGCIYREWGEWCDWLGGSMQYNSLLCSRMMVCVRNMWSVNLLMQERIEMEIRLFNRYVSECELFLQWSSLVSNCLVRKVILPRHTPGGSLCEGLIDPWSVEKRDLGDWSFEFCRWCL